MFSLDATEEQLDFPHVYGSAKNNWMGHDWKVQTDSVEPLLDMILEHVPPAIQREGTVQMLVTSLDFSPYTGRMAIGRLHRGTLKENMRVTIAHRDGSKSIARMKELYLFEGLGKMRVKEVQSGDLCAISGIEKFEIGDTVTDLDNPEALATIAIDEPTLSMVFSINDSPFFGKEGKFVTSRHLKGHACDTHGSIGQRPCRGKSTHSNATNRPLGTTSHHDNSTVKRDRAKRITNGMYTRWLCRNKSMVRPANSIANGYMAGNKIDQRR